MAKIIATTGDKWNSGYLVEMTQGEIACLLGPGYAHKVLEGDKRAFDIGSELPIGEIWQRLNGLATLERTLSGVSSEMRKVADWLDTVPSIIEPPPPKTSRKAKDSDA